MAEIIQLMSLFGVLRLRSLKCAFRLSFSLANCTCKSQLCLHVDPGRQWCTEDLAETEPDSNFGLLSKC